MPQWPQGKWPVVKSGQGNGVQRSSEKSINRFKVNGLIELFVTTSNKASVIKKHTFNLLNETDIAILFLHSVFIWNRRIVVV